MPNQHTSRPRAALAHRFRRALGRTVSRATVALAGAFGFAGLLLAGASCDRAKGPAAPPAASASSVPATRPGERVPYTEAVPGTKVTFSMVPIPGGTFTMGSPESEAKRKPGEGPQVEVQVEPFYMGEHEITWAGYDEFLANYMRIGSGKLGPDGRHVPRPRIAADNADAVTYPTPMYEVEAGPMLDRMGRTDKHPAVFMSPYAARQYTKWLSKKTGRFYRLPTEAEWEYACRAGTTTAWSFGDDPKQLREHGWFYDNSELKDGDAAYHQVGTKKPNPWGLYDMHGNVAEYVLDQYADDTFARLAAGAGGKPVDWRDAVAWPTHKYPRICRGGGWESDDDGCRSASRFKVTVAQSANDPAIPKSLHWMSNANWIGFRVVSPVKEPTEAEKHRFWDAEDAETKQALELLDERQVREVIIPPPPPTTRPGGN